MFSRKQKPLLQSSLQINEATVNVSSGIALGSNCYWNPENLRMGMQ